MRRREKPNQAAFLLLAELLRSDRLPPITLGFIALNTIIYLELFEINYPGLGSVCLSANFLIRNRDWKRLILSHFFHGDDWHLYYNMISFSVKGRSLERRHGSVYFLFLLIIFTVCCSFMYILIELFAFYALGFTSSLSNCSVGFSAVIFALKVLTTHDLPEGTILAFNLIPVPSKYAYWAELVLISLVTPQASFAGHLAGILVGLLYIYGPLDRIINKLAQTFNQRTNRRPRFYTNNHYD
ncbi:unnamed protein product [Brachionus calyciflorus]|uniref:Peptidase S54 rhomboid domain-containing protein n=1 Tax=Brachionus calyciflorus TaxID=104777 RepID=A0A813YK20_9BILA|nr:unnamed protein product [Brachionus calyciflorus]